MCIYIYICYFTTKYNQFLTIYIYTHIIHVQPIYNSYTTHIQHIYIYNNLIFLVRITGMEFQLQFFLCSNLPSFWDPNFEVYILKLRITIIAFNSNNIFSNS